MSSHKAGERGKTSSRRHKKRQSDGDRNQGPRPLESPNIITMAATDGDVLYGKSLSGSPDPDVTKSNLAKKIAALVHNQEPKEKLMDVIAHLVEENAVEEIEMLREEVQKLKGMLHDATGKPNPTGGGGGALTYLGDSFLCDLSRKAPSFIRLVFTWNDGFANSYSALRTEGSSCHFV